MKSLEKKSKQRNITRFEAIIKTIQYLDEVVLQHSSESDFQIYTMPKKKIK